MSSFPFSMSQQQLYVSSDLGDDDNHGTDSDPLQTITAALRRATPDSTIYVLPGRYDYQLGEVFPLIIPEKVSLIGDVATQGQGIMIRGSGVHHSLHLRTQNVAIALSPDSELHGVTVINEADKGSGVWIDEGRVTIENNCFQGCQREGIFAAGKSKPLIFDNLFIENEGNGIFLAGNAKGEICHNQFQDNNYAIALNEFAAPLIAHNRIFSNRIGVFIARISKPVLRRNLIENNRSFGIIVSGDAQPDFGLAQDPAGNILRNNLEADLRNKTDDVVVSVGNELNPETTAGMVDFGAVAVPMRKAGMTPFRDVLSHWAEPFIQVLVEEGYIQGFPDGTFRPDFPITRAEYAALLANCFELPRPLGVHNPELLDIELDFWGAEAITKAINMGFLVGYPDKTFRPQAPLTRLQALVSLAKGLGLKHGTPKVLQAFSDRPQVPSYALNAIAAATQNRLVVNYPQSDRLQPLRDIKRGEMAALLHQALVINQKLPVLNSPHIVDPLPYLPSFRDVHYHWAKPFISAIASMGLIQGYEDGSFKPDKLLNRAEFAALLNEIFAPSPVRPAGKFFDVPEDYWAAPAIQQVYRGGFLSGFPDQTFHPRQHLKRIQVILALTNGLHLPTAGDNWLDYYVDVAEISDYAQMAVASATKAGLIVNHPEANILNPKGDTTRAEVIAFCYQALVYLQRATPIESPAIVEIVAEE